jgi:hypothetical protein
LESGAGCAKRTDGEIVCPCRIPAVTFVWIIAVGSFGERLQRLPHPGQFTLKGGDAVGGFVEKTGVNLSEVVAL